MGRFWTIVLIFCLISVPENFSQKKWKKSLFFKIVSTDPILKKNVIFIKIVSTDRIFNVPKIKNPMPWPIDFYKKSKKWALLEVIGSRKRKLKNPNFEIQIMIFPFELWEKSPFCSEKIAFSQFFFQKYPFFSSKNEIIEYNSYFLLKQKSKIENRYFTLIPKNSRTERILRTYCSKIWTKGKIFVA